MENHRWISAMVFITVGSFRTYGNKPTTAPSIADPVQRSPPGNHSGPYAPEVGRYIQIATNSHDLQIDLNALAEDMASRVNPNGGYRPEVMLKTAYTNSHTDLDTFSADMNALLKKFVRHRMSIVSIFTDRFYDGDFKKLLTRYKFVEQPLGARPSPTISSDDFTLYRLVAAFPYETAQIRARHVDDTWLPGLRGSLNHVLAFPYAPLIIPASWNETRALWRKWYDSFSTAMVGYPLSAELKRRQEKQYQSMLAIAKERESSLLEMMELLGVTEPPGTKPIRA